MRGTDGLMRVLLSVALIAAGVLMCIISLRASSSRRLQRLLVPFLERTPRHLGLALVQLRLMAALLVALGVLSGFGVIAP